MTKRSKKEIKAKMDKMFVDIPEDLGDAQPIVYSDEIEEGPLRDEAEKAMAELREKRRGLSTGKKPSKKDRTAREKAQRQRDDPQPPAKEDPTKQPDTDHGPGLNETEIRAKGYSVHVPFEAPAPAKGSMRYSDGTTMEERFRKEHPDFFPEDDAAAESPSPPVQAEGPLEQVEGTMSPVEIKLTPEEFKELKRKDKLDDERAEEFKRKRKLDAERTSENR